MCNSHNMYTFMICSNGNFLKVFPTYVSRHWGEAKFLEWDWTILIKIATEYIEMYNIYLDNYNVKMQFDPKNM